MYPSFGPPIPGFQAPQGLLPIGTIISFAGEIEGSANGNKNAPKTPIESLGWMLCDGRTLDIKQYLKLYAVLGLLYGGDINKGEFQIPDFRGYFLRGAMSKSNPDQTLKVDPDIDQRAASANGTKLGPGSTQGGALQNHQHHYQKPDDPTAPCKPGPKEVVPKSTQALTSPPVSDEMLPKSGTNKVNLKVSDNETRPVNIYVNFLIKYT